MESLNGIMVLFGGIFSFFSPCIIPILPLYFSYLSGSAKTIKEDGTIMYRQSKIFLSTICFVLGISFAFLLLGLSVAFLGNVFGNIKYLISILCGIIIVFFGLMQLGIIRLPKFSQEKKLPFKINLQNMNLFSTFLLGFTFSFAWTPCVGPVLSSVLLLVASSSKFLGALYLILYILGFILPFLIIGLFTTTVLNFLKKNQKALQYTIKIAGIILIVMGTLLIYNNAKSFFKESPQQEIYTQAFVDQDGESHQLEDFKGKVVVLSFLDRYCSGCQEEMPILKELAKEQTNFVIVGAMKVGTYDSLETVQTFTKEQKFGFPVLMDQKGDLAKFYEVNNYPMLFFLDETGAIKHHILGATSKDNILKEIGKLTENCENERMC